ncbi:MULTISPECIES: hypothetical protein [Sinorhizobium]|uniref:hypothetical protein n=1 Tax=unclassified Sinorhizobium TaxID=2613772 RepID=UPI001596A68B|nr:MULTISPECIES: hypothetical protein [Sinorhizobium]
MKLIGATAHYVTAEAALIAPLHTYGFRRAFQIPPIFACLVSIRRQKSSLSLGKNIYKSVVQHAVRERSV